MILIDMRLNPVEFMNDKIIISLEDFFSSNSSVLINDFGLNLFEIPKNFLDLSKERRLPDFKMTVNYSDDPLNFYDILSKKFASSAIVRYELVNRKEIFFFYDEKILFVKDFFGPSFQLKMARRDDYTAYDMKRLHFNYLNCFRN